MEPDVVLVDEADREVGVQGRLAAHEAPGALHRAISVFVFNGPGRVLLQRRDPDKPVFGGRWANTCCTHPLPGEEPLAAGTRRLREEMGIEVTLLAAGTFVYQATDPVSGLAEHEFDHVLVGRGDVEPRPDPTEVAAWRWADADELLAMGPDLPDDFAPWLYPGLEIAVSLL